MRCTALAVWLYLFLLAGVGQLAAQQESAKILLEVDEEPWPCAIDPETLTMVLPPVFGVLNIEPEGLFYDGLGEDDSAVFEADHAIFIGTRVYSWLEVVGGDVA